MKAFVGRYAKFLVAAAAAAGLAVQSALTDGHVSEAEWVGIAVAAIGAILVYLVPNTPPAPPG